MYLVEKLLNRIFLGCVQIVLDLARILPQINALRQHLAQNFILLELLEVVCRGGGRGTERMGGGFRERGFWQAPNRLIKAKQEHVLTKVHIVFLAGRILYDFHTSNFFKINCLAGNVEIVKVERRLHGSG
jgi:hypothetical protein